MNLATTPEQQERNRLIYDISRHSHNCAILGDQFYRNSDRIVTDDLELLKRYRDAIKEASIALERALSIEYGN